MNNTTAISAHFIHEKHGMVYRKVIDHAPRVGDEIRISESTYYKVTMLVWVYDEPECPYQRLNIGVT